MRDRPPLDWNAIDLVIFDVDGTLYDQRALRTRMAWRLALASLHTLSLDTALTLRAFRRCREALGQAGGKDFLEEQYALTAARRGCSADAVRALVEEWIERRPLALLAACRRRHLDRLFAALHAKGKTIAVYSDYPARQKMAALGLSADIIVSSTDEEVRRLKPDPAGLARILDIAGVPPQRALMIGDRADRDAVAAAALGVRALILSRRGGNVQRIRSFGDRIFRDIIDQQQSVQRTSASAPA